MGDRAEETFCDLNPLPFENNQRVSKSVSKTTNVENLAEESKPATRTPTQKALGGYAIELRLHARAEKQIIAVERDLGNADSDSGEEDSARFEIKRGQVFTPLFWRAEGIILLQQPTQGVPQHLKGLFAVDPHMI